MSMKQGKFNFRKKLRSLPKRWRRRILSMSFLLPSMVGVGLFFIIPFGVVACFSMVDSPFNPSFAGFSNYARLLENSAFLNAAKNTAIFALTAVPLAVILSLLMAIILEQNIPLRSTFRTFFLTPLMVPTASIVLIWQVFFHINGSINEMLLFFGHDKIDWFKSSASYFVIQILFLWKNLGYNMILFMSGLHNIPSALLEYADVEGASEWYKFWAIKLRYLSPTVLFVTILSLINSFKIFREVYLLAGNYPYEGLYTLQHFMNNMFNSLDYQKLSAAAIIMAIVMIVLIALLFIIENWFGKDVEG